MCLHMPHTSDTSYTSHTSLTSTLFLLFGVSVPVVPVPRPHPAPETHVHLCKCGCVSWGVCGGGTEGGGLVARPRSARSLFCCFSFRNKPSPPAAIRAVNKIPQYPCVICIVQISRYWCHLNTDNTHAHDNLRTCTRSRSYLTLMARRYIERVQVVG